MRRLAKQIFQWIDAVTLPNETQAPFGFVCKAIMSFISRYVFLTLNVRLRYPEISL